MIMLQEWLKLFTQLSLTVYLEFCFSFFTSLEDNFQIPPLNFPIEGSNDVTLSCHLPLPLGKPRTNKQRDMKKRRA